MGLGQLLLDKKVIFCVGAGGVGKTTTAAVLARAAARAGRTALVCTIDPARRLADALGLASLDHTERRVPDAALGASRRSGGALFAMMLDQKLAFDELVARHILDPGRRARILESPIYAQVSSTLTGSLEYAAVAKLQALAEQGRYDLLVLDTPPTSNALDFLDAPEKLVAALDSPIASWASRASGRASLRLLGKGGVFVLRRLARFVGSQFLDDIAVFLADFNEAMGGFRARAQEVLSLLHSPRAGFVLVAAPEPLAIDEAFFFYERLLASELPVSAFVINRVRRSEGRVVPLDSVVAALARRTELSGASPAEIAEWARLLVENATALETLAQRDAREIARLRAQAGLAPLLLEVPLLPYDLGGTEGLDRIEAHLLAAAPSTR